MLEPQRVGATERDDMGSSLPTHEEPAEVVPGEQARAVVDERVDGAVGDGAQIERRGAEYPHLPAGQPRRRPVVQDDDGIADAFGGGGRDGGAVARRAFAAQGPVAHVEGLVHHKRREGSVAVHGTDARREPREADRRVGGAVDRVDHGDETAVECVRVRLLAQHPEPSVEQHRHGHRVRNHVVAVLPRAVRGLAPVDERVESLPDRLRDVVEQIQQPCGIHDRNGILLRCGRPRPASNDPVRESSHVAIVDIATFIADLKDQVSEFGFHVHDERHFVETYTMRQAWEIDLHPAHACGGPLDVHMSLDVDPRVMFAFEDAVMDLPEDAEPPDDFRLPIMITWTLPPLPNGPDLLVLATDLAGIGRTELPLEVSAIDMFGSVTDPAERSLNIAARAEISLAHMFMGREQLNDVLERALQVSEYLLDRAHVWLDD